MQDWEKIQETEARYCILAELFLVHTQLETLGNGGRYLGELTTKQWFLLLNLQTFYDEPPALNKLAAQMGTSHQNVKAIAMNLETKGFVRIEKDKTDSRVLRIVPTEKCLKYGKEHAEGNREFINMVFGVLSDREADVMNKCLRKLIDRLDTIRSSDKA